MYNVRHDSIPNIKNLRFHGPQSHWFSNDVRYSEAHIMVAASWLFLTNDESNIVDPYERSGTRLVRTAQGKDFRQASTCVWSCLATSGKVVARSLASLGSVARS